MIAQYTLKPENVKFIITAGTGSPTHYAGWVKKKSPLTKCEAITPNPEINEIRFQHIDPDVGMLICGTKNGIDRSRNAWAIQGRI